jgi:hypothetical protein
MKKDIKPKNFDKDTSSVLDATLLELAEGLTGILASKKEERILAIGHIFQRIRGGKFLSQLNNEWKSFREKGKIKDDYQYTEQHQECLQEILDYLDNSLPSQITFEILKKLFLLASTETISDRESLLPQAYMRIIKRLSPEAILILISWYKLENRFQTLPEKYKTVSRYIWFEEITKDLGFNKEILVIYEKELMDFKLLHQEVNYKKSEIETITKYRLTDLGFDICQYIENYDDIASPSN